MLHRDYTITPHTHDCIEINVVARGTGTHYVGKSGVRVKAGDTYVIPPSVPHAYADEQGLDVWHMLLRPAFAAECARDFRHLPGYILLFTAEPFFRCRQDVDRYSLRLEPAELRTVVLFIEELVAEQERERGGHVESSEALASLGRYVILRLCRNYRLQHPTTTEERRGPSQKIANALALVERRFATPLRLEDLAGVAHMHPTHFSRVFRKATGFSPMAYVNEVRIHEVQRLLTQSDLMTQAIALEAGFCDAPHLTRAFRRVAGITPSQYRQAHLRPV